MEQQHPSCTCGNGKTTRIIYSCSGIGSNVGQLANAAACRLTLEGFGSGSCLAGLGGNVDKLISTGREADERVVIDGCPVACAKKIMDISGLPINRYVMITELGIEKTPGPVFNEKDVQTVIDAVKNVVP
ncbi:MAG: putative zinc-binding protein [Methanoregula sp.]|nr:putative zinc-binding protein [Methanoregula sp.]